MKKVIFVLLICLYSTISFADKLILPFDCYPKQLQQKFLDKGIKLELSEIDRSKDSWGFLKNEGAQFIIYTYKSITKQELKLVQQIIMNAIDINTEA